MCCYIIPTTAAIISSVVWKKGNKGAEGWWLNLMLYGGAAFGVVDHWWNGELFLISEAIVSDLALGFAITAVIFAAWGILTAVAGANPGMAKRMGLASKA